MIMLPHPVARLALAVWALRLCCFDAEGALPIISETVKSRIRARVDYGYNPSVVVGMVNSDGRTWFSYGQRILGTESPVNENTIYEIGSVTKVFTSLLLADAVARGEVALGQRLQTILPEDFRIPTGVPEISLLHLATHRSGLPGNPSNLCSEDPLRPFECYTEARLREFLHAHVLARSPEAAWEYSNLGFGLLGFSLSRRLAVPYAELLRERVLEPLGLHDTGPAPPASENHRLAFGYNGPLLRPSFHMGVLEGAGDLRSTASDMLRFVEFNLRLVTNGLSATLDGMRQQRSTTAYPGIQQGLGWWLWDLPGGRIVQHGGNTMGHSAFVGFHPVKKLGVVVLSNARIDSVADITDLGLHLLDGNYPLTTIRRPVTVSEESLLRLLGTYRAESGDLFLIRMEQGRLVIEHPRSRTDFPAYALSTTRFEALSVGLAAGTTAGFQIDPGASRARSMLWTQNGVATSYLRQPDPNRLSWGMRGNVVVLSLVGEDGGDYSVQTSTDLSDWGFVGTLSGVGKTLEVPVRAAPSAAFFRATKVEAAASLPPPVANHLLLTNPLNLLMPSVPPLGIVQE